MVILRCVHTLIVISQLFHVCTISSIFKELSFAMRNQSNKDQWLMTVHTQFQCYKCCYHCARVLLSAIEALLSNCSYNCGLAACLLLVLSAWLWCWLYYYTGVCSRQRDCDVGFIITQVSVLVSMVVMLLLLLHRCLFLSAWLWCWLYYYTGVCSRQHDCDVGFITT